MPALKQQANWRDTRIGATELAKDSDPFAELQDGGSREESRALLDALGRFHARFKPKKKRLRSVAFDSSKFLDPEANAQVALADLGKKIDINRPEIKSWYQVLWNTAAKLNPASKIKDMPKSVVDFCLRQMADGSASVGKPYPSRKTLETH